MWQEIPTPTSTLDPLTLSLCLLYSNPFPTQEKLKREAMLQLIKQVLPSTLVFPVCSGFYQNSKICWCFLGIHALRSGFFLLAFARLRYFCDKASSGLVPFCSADHQVVRLSYNQKLVPTWLPNLTTEQRL